MPPSGPRQEEQEQVEKPVLSQTAQPAASDLAPLGAVGMSALGRMGGSQRVQLARSLVGHMGNAAFSRMIMRAPPTAATAAAAAALAPDGPLSKLRDELDDTFVDEDDCLTWIGQLGPGEKTLVGRDATMRQQMIDAFNVQEMLRAVEMLALPVKHQIDWIRQAGNLQAIGAPAIGRLLTSATVNDFGELVGWDDVRAAVQHCWGGDPLTLVPVTQDPARATQWLATAGFAGWALQRSGAARVAIFTAADAVNRIAALKTAGKWNEVISGLRGNAGTGPARDSLHALFTAATDAADRRALYEIRFNTRAAGPVDWVANGEATWTTQETTTGTGQTAAQVQAAITAGGPATAEATATADAEGPMAQLRDELDDTFVDEDLCLRLLAQLTDREIYLVGRDQTMLNQMQSAFNGAEMTRAIGLLRFLPLKQALAFAARSGDADDVPSSLYRTLVDRATSQDVAEAIGWPQAMNVLKDANLNPLALGALATDDAQFQNVLQTYPAYTDWIVSGGFSSQLVRHMSTHGPLPAITALVAAAKLDAVLGGLRTGAQMPPADQNALKLIFLAATNVPTKKKLLMKRFNVDSMGTEGGAPEFEAPALDQIWILLERLPPTHVADNAWFQSINRMVQSSATAPNGVTGSNRVGLGYSVGQMGAPEAGAFTDPADAMRGTNMFDSNLVHEMGHAADAEFNYTRDGGPFDTEADLGQWQSHPDLNQLVVDWAATLNLSATVPNAADRTGVIQALQWDMANSAAAAANPQAGFQNQAGAAWGTAGDPWQARWTAVQAHALVAQVQQAQGSNSPWMNPPAAIGTRIYHDTGYNYWASYLSATRAGGKLSRYQFRDKRDFFAETYATFYLTPADPGSLVRGWNNRVYQWFLTNVDRGFSTQATP
jgi:hypothetical protein